jgi:branched-chain amino acid transport system substrate-binding protein
VSAYEGSAKEFADNYKAAYGADPEAYAIYGYEAAKVALAAIAAAGVKDRTKIRDAVFATKDFKGILGTWGFDANGDTSVTTMSVSIAARLADGTLSWEKVEILTAG